MAQKTMTSDFNSDRWYQILLSNETLALAGTPCWDGFSFGSLLPGVQNRTDFQQQWQIYQFNDTFFVLRTRASGPDNYLRVMESIIGDGLPIMKPRMVKPMLPDASMLWTMGKWADGSFYLWNAENGTNWHLNTTLEEMGHTEMISLNPQPKAGQAFSFKELGEINNQTFSTINTPPSLARATPSAAAGATEARTSSSSSPTKPASKDSPSGASNGQVTSSSGSGSGLSTGAEAAIGVCVAIAVVVLFALALFWVRRCRRRRQNRAALEVLKVHPEDFVHERAGPTELSAESKPSEMDGVVKYEIGGAEKYEMGDGRRERPVHG